MMAVAVSNGTTPVRSADRTAMRGLLEVDFPHAVPSIAQAIAVAVVSALGADVDERLGQMADQVEIVILDALVVFAKSHGWKGNG